MFANYVSVGVLVWNGCYILQCVPTSLNSIGISYRSSLRLMITLGANKQLFMALEYM